MYSLDDYDYDLPAELIAQHPAAVRDRSRLMVLPPGGGRPRDRRFHQIATYFRPGDVLVINNTAVVPGRLVGRKPTGGRVEVLLLNYAQAMARRGVDGTLTFDCLFNASRRVRPGTRLRFDADLEGVVVAGANGIGAIRFTGQRDFEVTLAAIGRVPLPPYIQRGRDSAPLPADRNAYQTVYARHNGAVAAPTAGLHFTPELLSRIRSLGVTVLPVTLHVGYGTFRPVSVDDIRDHRMHAEHYTLDASSAQTLNAAKSEGRRVIAVGTTCVRTLEYAASAQGRLKAGAGACDLFIYPGYRFKVVDALITNFHLPRSTLLMLVSALAGRERILAAYRTAINRGYRFYSYGDAMLIL
jgi:S-adenosylmethionine:tRNA ribosyltransferase-isomerase